MQQKHPVQLNPLTFVPLKELNPPVEKAYQERYALCYGVNEAFIPGWTLGAYWLAASHMRDGKAMIGEFDKILANDYTDKDMLQFYESSRYYWMQYYTTTHGLYLQALNDAIVSDYWGSLEVGSACPDDWESVAFNKLHTSDGRKVSGEKSGINWLVDYLEQE